MSLLWTLSANNGRSRSRAWTAGVVSSLVISFLSPATPPRAEAAFPGRNGQLVFAVGQDPTRQYVDGSFMDFNLFTVSQSGEGLRQLTSAPGAEVTPSWSPDGRSIAFAGGSILYTALDIEVVDAVSGDVVNLTQSPTAPDWSPDGRKLLFVTAAPENFGLPVVTCGCNSDVWVVNRDGTGLRNLTRRSDADDYSAAWSPDGKKIAFTSDRSGSRQLYMMNPDGSGVLRLLDIQLDSGGAGLDWGPRP